MERHQEMRRDTPGARVWSRKPRKPLAKRSKKAKARSAAVGLVKDAYFDRFGWDASDGTRLARCQVCGWGVPQFFAEAHHKVLRSKRGSDNAYNLLICHSGCHRLFLHDGCMGNQTVNSKDRLERAMLDTANAENGDVIHWSAQQLLDVQTFKRWA